jgi:hypothetical protein
MGNQEYFAIMVGMSVLAVLMFILPRKQLGKWLEPQG